MSVINTNVKSLVAQNAMTTNNRALSNAMEQLSTGKRINGAKDDAAGLAISNKMTSQIRGLNQAVRNANDGISMLQTAEGAMVEITNMMQRMRELAVQSANDTNTQSDRNALDLEFQQLKQETARITNNTQWNGVNILNGAYTGNGTAGDFKFQVGANANQTISHTINNLGFAAAATGSIVSDPVNASNVNTAKFTVTTAAVTNFAEGDEITLNINGSSFIYKVTATDVAVQPTTDVDNGITIATSIRTALTTQYAGLTVSGAANSKEIILTAGTNQTFTATASVSNGQLSSLSGLNISQASTANTAISSLSTAIAGIDSGRAGIGAKINRLTYAADNLTNVAQNTTESRSRILDTDYAATTTELAKSQIISQAATAMLAQANQAPQSVLSLVR